MRRIAEIIVEKYIDDLRGADGANGTVTIIVIENGVGHHIATHHVDSKFAARAIAAQYNAKPRNF